MLIFSADNRIIRLESMAIHAYIHGRRALAEKLWGMAEERRETHGETVRKVRASKKLRKTINRSIAAI